MRGIGSGGSTRPFFGSWYELQSHRQTGYYLGHELVTLWHLDYLLEQIALWSADEIGVRTQAGLAAIASG